MTTPWTAVFTLPGLADDAADLAENVNSFGGKALLLKLTPLLAARGWTFGEPSAEDFGWESDSARLIDGKSVALMLIGSPEGATLPNGSAEDDRWRVTIDLNLGMFSKTKAARTAVLTELARDAQSACVELGATALRWENGPLSSLA